MGTVNGKVAVAEPLVIDSHRPSRGDTALRAWRKRQMVFDEAAKCRRRMKLTDVPRLYGIATSTWHGWEVWPDEDSFRRPEDANMQRLFEITGGEVTPNDFHPIDAWAAALPQERQAG